MNLDPRAAAIAGLVTVVTAAGGIAVASTGDKAPESRPTVVQSIPPGPAEVEKAEASDAPETPEPSASPEPGKSESSDAQDHDDEGDEGNPPWSGFGQRFNGDDPSGVGDHGRHGRHGRHHGHHGFPGHGQVNDHRH